MPTSTRILACFALALTAACTAPIDAEGEDTTTSEAAVTAVSIDVPFVLQNPELPRGCEVTSLTMLLRHAGVNADKMTLAAQVKKVPYQDGALRGDPYEGFVGSMTTFAQPGYGVYHGPIDALAQQYVPGRVADLTGAAFDDLLVQHVAKKRPVWIVTNATFAPLAAGDFQTWSTKNGPARITWHEHSVVVTGFDATTVTINDPLDARGKNKKLPRAAFRTAWEQMGKQAIVILPPPGAEAPFATQANAACAAMTAPAVPAMRAPSELAPFDLVASHAIARADLRPGDALARHVSKASARHVASFAGWADAARTVACVAEPGAAPRAVPPAALAELTPIRFVTSPGGWRSDPIGVDCSVHADGRLYCTNTAGAAMRSAPQLAAPIVNRLRTTYSWFTCWGTGEMHAGGNTTWYRTIGDDNASAGWIPAVDLATTKEFDADPSARGLPKCAP